MRIWNEIRHPAIALSTCTKTGRGLTDYEHVEKTHSPEDGHECYRWLVFREAGVVAAGIVDDLARAQWLAETVGQLVDTPTPA